MKYLHIACLALIPSLVPAADSLMAVGVPDQVYSGEVVPVTVTYEATQNRDIAISFQLDTSPWTGYGYRKVSVAAGSDTIVIDVTLNESTPIATDAYKFGVSLQPEGGSWGWGGESLGGGWHFHLYLLYFPGSAEPAIPRDP